MEIRYQLEPADLEALTAFVHRGTPVGWALQRLPWVVLVAVAVPTATQFDRQHPWTSGVPIAIVALFCIFFWRRRHRGLKERGTALFAPSTLVLTPDSVLSSAPGRESRIAWSQVLGYGETDDHVFMMLDGLSGYVIPKRQLGAKELSEFVSLLGRHTQVLARRGRDRSQTLFRVVLLWVVVLVVLFLAWHLAQPNRLR